MGFEKDNESCAETTLVVMELCEGHVRVAMEEEKEMGKNAKKVLEPRQSEEY